MRALFPSLSLIIVLLICSASASARSWDVLIVPIATETLERSHPAYEAVELGVSQSFVMGANVQLASADLLGLDLSCDGDDCERVLIERIRANSRASNTLELVVFVELRRSQGLKESDLKLIGKGEIHNIQSNTLIHTWNEDVRERIRSDCTGECLNAQLIELSTSLGNNLGGVLADIVKELNLSATYTIRIEGFLAGEVNELTEAFGARSGWRVDSFDRESRGEWLHQVTDVSYELDTRDSATDVQALLSQMIEEVTGTEPDISTILGESNAYQVARGAMPYAFLYYTGLFLLIVGGSGGSAFARFNTHNARLAQWHQAQHPQLGVNYLSDLKLFPKIELWRGWETEWKQQIRESDACLRQAQNAVQEFNYEEAQKQVAEALVLNQDNEEAATLRDKLPDWARGYQLLQQGEAELFTDPVSSERHLQEAVQLNPQLAKQVDRLKERAQEAGQQEALGKQIQQVSALLAEHQYYEALGAVQRALDGSTLLEGFDAEKEQLQILQREILTSIPPINSNFQLTRDLANVEVLLGDQVTIGRKSSSGGVGLILDYKRLSRPGKQTSLCRVGDRFVVQDDRSTNGTSVDGRFLDAGASAKAEAGTKVGLGGNPASNAIGGCILELNPAEQSRASMVVKFDQNSMTLLDRSGFGEAWPSLERDLFTTWVLLGESLAVGIYQGRFDLGCLKGVSPVFYLHHQTQGVTISTALKGEASELFVAGVQVRDSVPLTNGAEVVFRDLEFGCLQTGGLV